ncbi:hypothetical protein [Kitasatospora sp. NPDC089509]|uniref:hypothetical protein n=1 Tax=Kitasatospora sp. NPDC089509 TaxID=3364079 RepID=UPI00382E2BE2
METENDARGNKADIDIDARRIEGKPETPHCPECDTELRTTGPGRRPVYCGRGCSSRAYRRRRSEGQQDAVADALIASRVETPDDLDDGPRQLMELAAAVQRASARYLERLEQARRGEGDDPRCNQALKTLETAITGATQRLLRQANVLRYEMTATRLNAASEGAAGEAAPAFPESSRVESSAIAGPVAPVVGHLISPRVETSGTGGSPVLAASTVNTSRVESPQAAPAGAVPQPSTVPVEELRLALAAERSSTSPLLRHLGAPTATRADATGSVLVESWNADPRVLAVRRPDRRLVGWLEHAASGNGWAVFIDGRAVVDAADALPWLAENADHALTLLLVALDQHLA